MGRPGDVREDTVVGRRPHRAAQLPSQHFRTLAPADRRPDGDVRHAEPPIRRQTDASLSAGQQSLIGSVTLGFGGGQLIAAVLAVAGPAGAEAADAALLIPPTARADGPP